MGIPLLLQAITQAQASNKMASVNNPSPGANARKPFDPNTIAMLTRGASLAQPSPVTPPIMPSDLNAAPVPPGLLPAAPAANPLDAYAAGGSMVAGLPAVPPTAAQDVPTDAKDADHGGGGAAPPLTDDHRSRLDQAAALRQQAIETRRNAMSGKAIVAPPLTDVQKGIAGLLMAIHPELGHSAMSTWQGQENAKAQTKEAERQQKMQEAEYAARGMELHADQLQGDVSREVQQQQFQAELKNKLDNTSLLTGGRTTVQLQKDLDARDPFARVAAAAMQLRTQPNSAFAGMPDDDFNQYLEGLKAPRANDLKAMADADFKKATTQPTADKLTAQGHALQAGADSTTAQIPGKVAVLGATAALKGKQGDKAAAQTETIDATRAGQVKHLLASGRLKDAQAALAGAQQIATQHRMALQDTWYPKKMQSDIDVATKRADSDATRAQASVVNANRAISSGKPISDGQYLGLHDQIEKSQGSLTGAMTMLDREWDSLQARAGLINSGKVTAGPGEVEKMNQLADANRAKKAGYQTMLDSAKKRGDDLERIRGASVGKTGQGSQTASGKGTLAYAGANDPNGTFVRNDKSYRIADVVAAANRQIAAGKDRTWVIAQAAKNGVTLK